jgi:uracil-DNA glycosylase
LNARIGELADRISACRICRDTPRGRQLPHEPRPVLVMSPTARIAICGQAPGTRVHASGRPFTDPSGDRLRDWMGIGEDIFYDAARIAIVPMGFCFPGLDAKGGDLPPCRECAPAWRGEVFAAMPQIRLLLLVCAHAQKWHLGAAAGESLTATVAACASIAKDPAFPPGRCRIQAGATMHGCAGIAGSRPNCCRACARRSPANLASAEVVAELQQSVSVADADWP